MKCFSLCAFAEKVNGVVAAEALYPGQEVEVPDALIDMLVACGHIKAPKRPVMVSEPVAPPKVPDPADAAAAEAKAAADAETARLAAEAAAEADAAKAAADATAKGKGSSAA